MTTQLQLPGLNNSVLAQLIITSASLTSDLSNLLHAQWLKVWIVIQQRVDLNTSWDRPWNDYKNGFGTIGANYWLGLEYVHLLTRNATYRLRIELQDNTTDKWYSVEYSTFRVGDEANTNYTLTVAGWTSDGFGTQTGDLLKADYNAATDVAYEQYHHSGMQFTTRDRQNDKRVGTGPVNCATVNVGGWWFNDCFLFCATCGYSTHGNRSQTHTESSSLISSISLCV